MCPVPPMLALEAAASAHAAREARVEEARSSQVPDLSRERDVPTESTGSADESQNIHPLDEVEFRLDDIWV